MFHIRGSEPTAERWVLISCVNYHEPDEFVALVKEYQSYLLGKIIKISNDGQYGIDNDPLKLVFQWDDLFGIVVIIPIETELMIALKALQKLCETANEKLAGHSAK